MNEREEWLAWRRSGIGASDAAVVAGKAPWGSRFELWLDKRGQAPERPASEAMELGLLLEPAIAAMYSRKTGVALADEQVRMRSDQHPFMLATLDRTTTDGDIVELKAAGLWASRDLGADGESDSLPEHWILQGHHQMVVAGRERMAFAVLLPTLEVRIYPVERNPALCSALVELEREFWRHVVEEIPPDDLAPQDAATIAGLYQDCHGSAVLGEQDAQAATDYATIGSEIRDLEKRREVARARLLQSMENCEIGILPDGREIHRKVIQMAERTLKAGTQTRLSIKEAK